MFEDSSQMKLGKELPSEKYLRGLRASGWDFGFCNQEWMGEGICHVGALKRVHFQVKLEPLKPARNISD